MILRSPSLPLFLSPLLRSAARRSPARGAIRPAFCRFRTMLTLPRLPLFEALKSHPADKPAVVHSVSGKTFTYGSLLQDVAELRGKIVGGITGDESADLKEERVAILVENGYEYVVSLLAVFASGGIAVPLCTSHPPKEQRYVLGDSQYSKLIATSRFRERADEITDLKKENIFSLDDFSAQNGTKSGDVALIENDWMSSDRGSLIIYTSGTTNLPKGVVSTHLGLTSQSQSLVKAWNINSSDYLLHVLPLHHVHGIVNATLAPLFAGATIEYLFPFNAQSVWSRLGSSTETPITLFMAVPTVYNRLINTIATLPEDEQASGKKAIANLRLAISGSAALPSSIRTAWRDLAGTSQGGGTMLERYGMTEIGMGLSNKLDKRVNDAVGWPLPGVEARLVSNDTGKEITEPGVEGEIQIRGPTVFREYWQKPEATKKEFAEGRWFKTGDVAVKDGEGCYFIKGRASVDIIKSGGEKISALEIERELLETGKVSECAVVGVEDADWGQRVAAILVMNDGYEWTLDDMRKEMKTRLAAYKVPTVLKKVNEIPRNQMGKINKKTLVKDVFG